MFKLSFSDQVNADLAEPSLRFGWRTAAIIPELQKEIAVFEGSKFKLLVHRLNELEFEYHKVADCDAHGDPYCEASAQKLLKERRAIKVKLGRDFNRQLFRMILKRHLPLRLVQSSDRTSPEPTMPDKLSVTQNCTHLQSETWIKSIWTEHFSRHD